MSWNDTELDTQSPVDMEWCLGGLFSTGNTGGEREVIC